MLTNASLQSDLALVRDELLNNPPVQSFTQLDARNAGARAALSRLAQALEAMEAREQPEECRLVAVDTGDGWCLSVERRKGEDDGDYLCLLAWPESWPEAMSAEALRRFGFEIH